MLRITSLLTVVVFSVVLCAQTPSAKNNNKTPVQKLEYDTTYNGWVQFMQDVIVDNSIVADKSGNLYCEMKTAEGKRIMKLVDGQWINIQGDIKDNYCYLMVDPSGTVYLRSEKIGYRQTSNGWEKVWDEKGIDDVYFGQNGKLYGHEPADDTKTDFNVVVYQNGYWQPCGKEKFPSKNTYRTTDKFGNIYLAYNLNEIGSQVFNIKKWDGKTWASMANNIGRVRFMNIDEKGELYIQVFESTVYRLRKWDAAMQNWKPITIPSLINSTEFVARLRNGQIQLCGEQLGENNFLIYGFINNSWSLEAKWAKGKIFKRYTDIFLPVGNKLYTIADCKLYEFDKTPTIISRSIISTQPIPLVGVSSEIPEIGALYSKSGIFIENGKKGVKGKSGNVIIHPVFDEISIEKAPQKYWSHEKYNYAFRLKNGSDEILCAYTASGPSTLYGFIDTMVRCPECGGKGKIKDKVVKVLVPGEYVPEKKKTTTTTIPVVTSEKVWNSRTNQYNDVNKTTYKVVENTVTEKAHRKEDTYKNEVVKGGTCSVCKGWALEITRNDFEYNPALKKYELKKIEYKDYNIE